MAIKFNKLAEAKETTVEGVTNKMAQLNRVSFKIFNSSIHFLFLYNELLSINCYFNRYLYIHIS